MTHTQYFISMLKMPLWMVYSCTLYLREALHAHFIRKNEILNVPLQDISLSFQIFLCIILSEQSTMKQNQSPLGRNSLQNLNLASISHNSWHCDNTLWMLNANSENCSFEKLLITPFRDPSIKRAESVFNNNKIKVTVIVEMMATLCLQLWGAIDRIVYL